MRDLLDKVDSRAAKLNMIILKLVEDFDEKIEEITYEREEHVDNSDDEGINLKSSELEMKVSKAFYSRDVVKCHIEVKHEEVVYSFTRYVGVAVKDRTDNEGEEEVYRESDKEILKTFSARSESGCFWQQVTDTQFQQQKLQFQH